MSSSNSTTEKKEEVVRFPTRNKARELASKCITPETRMVRYLMTFYAPKIIEACQKGKPSLTMQIPHHKDHMESYSHDVVKQMLFKELHALGYDVIPDTIDLTKMKVEWNYILE
jgi:hypothetical protein